MIKTKENGITLIALIITIIVMLILVAVTVNVAISGGLFKTAQDAARRTEMEAIRERAETVKATLRANSETDENIKFDMKTYKERLQKEFKDSELGLTKVIVEKRKYDIIILDSDLNIEVRIHSDDDSLLTTTDITSGGIAYNKYIEWNDGILAGVEVGTKQEILEGFLTFYINYGNVKEYNGTVIHDNLEELIQDEECKGILGEIFPVDMSGVTTKSEFYLKLIESIDDPEISITTEEECIEALYNSFFEGKTEKDICSNSWIAYVYKDGIIKDVKANIDGILNDSSGYNFKENGNYEIVIKSITGQELAREEVKCEGLSDKYDFVLEDGTFEVEGGNSYYGTDKGHWKTDGKGTIIECDAQESLLSEIVIPFKIGNERIIAIGREAFKEWPVKKVIIPSGIQTIGEGAFARCTNLTEVVMSTGLQTIEADAFYGCQNLSQVTLPNSLKRIDLLAFKDTGLNELYIPENVSYIEMSLFARKYFGRERLGSC